MRDGGGKGRPSARVSTYTHRYPRLSDAALSPTHAVAHSGRISGTAFPGLKTWAVLLRHCMAYAPFGQQTGSHLFAKFTRLSTILLTAASLPSIPQQIAAEAAEVLILKFH